MSRWTFALATGIGILPMTVLMVLMGDNIELMSWQGWLSLIAAATVLWFFVVAARGLISSANEVIVCLRAPAPASRPKWTGENDGPNNLAASEALDRLPQKRRDFLKLGFVLLIINFDLFDNVS